MTEQGGVLVLRPGLLTTVQDLGRVGYQEYGVSVSGAMDRPALLVANRLIGNPDGAAGLECTIQGPELRFEEDTTIAVTGADLSAALDGTPLPLWEGVSVRAGSVLAFGRRRSGARAYVAIAGGLDVPAVLGSRATHLRTRMGGLAGEPLKRGQRLRLGSRPAVSGRTVRAPAFVLGLYREAPTLRLVRGPQFHRLSPQAAVALTAMRFRIAPESDRMGYRLAGARIKLGAAPPMVSEASPQGSLQVPPDGRPILLMADHQTTGGYPIVGIVCSLDLSLAAQLMPGDSVDFSFVSAEAARAAAFRFFAWLDAELPQVRSSPGCSP